MNRPNANSKSVEELISNNYKHLISKYYLTQIYKILNTKLNFNKYLNVVKINF